MIVRRFGTVAAASLAAVALAAGPASAHFCFKNSLNEQAKKGQLGSNGWISFHDAVQSFMPLCEDGIALLAAAAGAPSVDTPIKAHGVMAGGTEKKAEPGNPAIGHLDFEAFDAAVPDAVAACE